MSDIVTNSELIAVFELLKSAGPTYYGNDDETAHEFASEWLDCFSLEACRYWINAGFWDATTAYLFADKWGSVELADGIIEELRENWNDPIYAMCNGDLPIPENESEAVE